VTVLGPGYLQPNAAALCRMVEKTLPSFSELVGAPARQAGQWTILVFPEPGGGANAAVGRHSICFRTGGLETYVDEHCVAGPIVVELPHNFRFGHSSLSRLFMWTPLKAEIYAQHHGPFTAFGGVQNWQWSVYAVLDFWMGRADKLEACIFPSFVLYQKHGFKPFRAYIDRQDTYETWLPAQGFTEGEALCAAFSECTGEDLTALFELSGWPLTAERVAQARKRLATHAR